MKRLLSLVLMMLCFVSISNADIQISDLVNKMPDMKQGIAFSLEDSEFNYITTMDITPDKISKLGINFGFGYSGDSDSTDHKIALTATYQVAKASDFTSIPIINLAVLDVGVYGAVGNVATRGDAENDNQGDFGLMINLFNLKF